MTSFQELSVDDRLKHSVEANFGFATMTEVQEKSIPQVVLGTDTFVKAKTGTGKTLAFLLPLFHQLLRNKNNSGKSSKKGGISALILSPTRELAQQIAAEADLLNKSLNAFEIATFVGGKNIKRDFEALKSATPNIIVATPGRFIDLLKRSQEEQLSLEENLRKLKIVILDEGDSLLDMGFQPSILKIFSYIPKDRQTLLYSATMPQSVIKLSQELLKPNFTLVDCVGEVIDQTHEQVDQYVTVTPYSKQNETLEMCIAEQLHKKADSKILVFLTVAKEAKFMALLFQQLGYAPLQMHSRMNQNQRENSASLFKQKKKAIMFSSDVSARGMDYPDIDLIIQVGFVTRDQYVQRLGRTARAGKGGQGILLLADFEADVVKGLLTGINLLDHPGRLSADASKFSTSLVEKNAELKKAAEDAYAAWMGYYKSQSRLLKWKPEDMVTFANIGAVARGLTSIPEIPYPIAVKLGIQNVPTANIFGKSNNKGKNRGRKRKSDQSSDTSGHNSKKLKSDEE
jgi:ATP-dependent RNA helicase MSS116